MTHLIAKITPQKCLALDLCHISLEFLLGYYPQTVEKLSFVFSSSFESVENELEIPFELLMLADLNDGRRRKTAAAAAVVAFAKRQKKSNF